ncbi:MAG: hypothetical protein ACJAYJ_003610 [Saprospiraceae bacterium]|jgi:hypothetical protein
MIPTFVFTQQNDWILKRNSDDIQVYYRESPDMDIYELRMDYYVETSLSGVVKLLDDVPNYTSWVYKLAETSMIQRINATDFYYYNRMDFPWPISDRDLVGYSKLWQERDTKIVRATVSSAHWKKNNLEDLVRITTLDIQWNLYPQKDGRVKIEYFLKSDPAGSIPAWMVNMALDQGPIETIKNMQRELKKAKYQGVKLAFIEEL